MKTENGSSVLAVLHGSGYTHPEQEVECCLSVTRMRYPGLFRNNLCSNEKRSNGKRADMIAYQHASRCPAAFSRLFGLSVEAFDALYAEFAVAYEQRRAQAPLTRRRPTPRKRRPGAGRRHRHALRDRLLLALFWLRVYPTLQLLGCFFSLDKTSAEDILKDVLATLGTMACFTLEHPGGRYGKLHTMEQVVSAFPDVLLVMDAGEQMPPTSREQEKFNLTGRLR
jgi:hypothetical protein